MKIKRFIVVDTRTQRYKIKKAGFGRTQWTGSIEKAQLFKTKGAAKIGMYSFNINPDRGKIGAKIILPDWVEIRPVEFSIS